PVQHLPRTVPGQALHVVDDALVPAADVEGVGVGAIGHAPLGDEVPGAAADLLPDRPIHRGQAVQAVVAAHRHLPDQVMAAVVGHVGRPVADPGGGPAVAHLAAGAEPVIEVVAA